MSRQNARTSSPRPLPQSPSALPPDTVEAELLNELSVYSDGRVGPWTERVVAIFRTLQSVEGAIDGLVGMPDEIGDRVAIHQLQFSARHAKQIAGEFALAMIGFSEPLPSKQLGGNPAPKGRI